VRLEGLGILKKIHLIGTQTRDLPACSTVPQPTMLLRAPEKWNALRILVGNPKGKRPGGRILKWILKN
jgi:hypothetical protein